MRHLVVDIGIEQGYAHFLERFADIGLGQPTAAPQAFEGITQGALQALEHGARLNHIRSGLLPHLGELRQSLESCILTAGRGRRNSSGQGCGQAGPHYPLQPGFAASRTEGHDA